MKKRILNIKQMTKTPYVNLYALQTLYPDGVYGNYYVASRKKEISNLKLNTKENLPDGVIIYSLYGENRDKVVLIRQYRYPIDDYIYEFPAGLVEENEDFIQGAIREMREETGLSLTICQTPAYFSKPFFTSIGMTDESCSMVFGYSSGEPTRAYQESSEDIEIVLADKNEVKRILKEENVSMMCAHMLLHFLHCNTGNPFDFLEIEE